MTRGCLIGVVFFGALAAGYYVALTPYFEWPGNAIAAGLGALFLSIFVSGFFGIFKAHRDARRLGASSTQTVGAFTDGETVAVAGTIRPIDAPITAPFSGTPCCAYDYDIIHLARRVSTDSSGGYEAYEQHDISGLALTPSIIETPTGGVRLLSFAMLEQFPQQVLNGPAPRAKATAYIAQTTFRPMGVSKVFSAINALSEALSDDDGAVRMDWRMNQDEIKLEAATIKERLLPVGQQVTAVGKYSADRRGLIADGMLSMIQLRPGDAETARRALLKQAYSGFVTGLVLFLISHGILVGVFYASETRYQRVSPSDQESALRIAVQDKNADEVRRVIRRGVNPNVRGSHNDTLLHDLRDADMVKVLTDAGADPNLINEYGYTPMMMAAHMGLTDVVQALLKAGGSPSVVRSDGATALSDAMEGGQAETVALLLANRATSDIVTAENGEALPADGGEPMQTVRAYLAGVHARDIKAMTAAFIPRKPSFFEGTDFDLWHKIRPQAPVFASGFTNGTHATLTIAGPTISNWAVTWHYQLIYKGETWRIAREWDTDNAPPAPSLSGVAPAGAEPVERPRK
jgi:hypothetical protein